MPQDRGKPPSRYNGTRRHTVTPGWATDLAVKIHQTFGGQPATIWEDELTNLDQGRATTAYIRLRREHEGRLSIARYLTVYQALNTQDAGNRPDPCPACADSGWVSHTGRDGDTLHYQAHRNPYTAAHPCRHCPAGKQAESSPIWRDAPTRNMRTITHLEDDL